MTARALQVERTIRRDEPQITGEPDMPPEEPPLDTAEFPRFPFAPPEGDAAQQPVPASPPVTLPPAPLPTLAPTPTPTPAPVRSTVERAYRRGLMGLGSMVAGRMAEIDILAHELAAQVGCPADAVDALLAGKSGGMTLDGLEGIAEKLGLGLVVQLRTFAPPTASQPTGRTTP